MNWKVAVHQAKVRDVRRLELLRSFHAQWHVMPTYEEIAELICAKSKSTVFAMVNRLESAGHLARTPTGRLRPGPKFFD